MKPTLVNFPKRPTRTRPANPTQALQCLIVADKLEVRSTLRELLKAHPKIEIVGEIESKNKISAVCKKLRPNVIFLDVDGAQALDKVLPAVIKLEDEPAIVFVADEPKHAILGFEVQAIDYLLKPVSPQRIFLTVNKLCKHFWGRDLPFKKKPNQPIDAQTQVDDEFIIKENSQLIRIGTNSTALVKAVSNYSRITLITGVSYMVRRRISRWNVLLDAQVYLRLNRSLIINFSKITKIERLNRDKSIIQLEGYNQAIEVGRSASIKIRKFLDKNEQIITC